MWASGWSSAMGQSCKGAFTFFPEFPLWPSRTVWGLRWQDFAVNRGGGRGQGCSRMEGVSEVALEAVRQAVGGGCQSGWGRLLLVTNAIEAGTWRQGDSGWESASRARAR